MFKETSWKKQQQQTFLNKRTFK